MEEKMKPEEGKTNEASKDAVKKQSEETSPQNKNAEGAVPEKKGDGNAAQNGKGEAKPSAESVAKVLYNNPLADRILHNQIESIVKLEREISDYRLLKTIVDSKIKELQDLIKPRKKGDESKKLTREKRESIRVEIDRLQDGRVDIIDQIEILSERLSSLATEESNRLTLRKLKGLSESPAYIKKNGFTVKKKLLDLLNGILEGDDEIKKASFENLRKLSFIEGEEGKKEFDRSLAELLWNTDEKTYILSSGRLKTKLYGAVRLTLQMWNPKEAFISKLVFPEDLLEDRKTAPDPFAKNRALISSLILRLFNRALSENRQTIISLRNLAQNPENATAFKQAIEEFVSNEDEEVYQIGSGGLRDRLNKTLQFTLLNWQPELPGGFEEVLLIAEHPFTVGFETANKDTALAISKELKSIHRHWEVTLLEDKSKWQIKGRNVLFEKNDPELSKQIQLLSLRNNWKMVE